MYDVQVMLQEAIEKTKDIEVCGQKNILSEFLKFCLTKNEDDVELYLRGVIYHRLAANHNIKGDFYDNWVQVCENIQNLETLINSNESLYEYAEKQLINLIEDVVQDFKVIWNVNITEKELNDMSSLKKLLGKDVNYDSNSN